MSKYLQWVIAAIIAIASLVYARMDHARELRDAEAREHANLVLTVQATREVAAELRAAVRQLEALVIDIRARLADTEALNRYVHGHLDEAVP